MLGATIPQAIGWIGGTAIGVFAGSVLDPEALGLDAMFLAFFLALLVAEVGDRTALLAAGLGALLTLALMPIAPPGVPVVAASLAALIGLWSRRR